MPALQLKPAAKHQGRMHRTLSPAETCKRVTPVAAHIGVTRVADITGLDRLGIPTYSCVRPLAHSVSTAGVSVTCGKGSTQQQAKAGALMEAIEYYCAEPGVIAMRFASYADLSGSHNCLDPVRLILPSWSPYDAECALHWVEGYDIASDKTMWLPANAVFQPFAPEEDGAMILRGNTAGLAAGNTLEEAVCHALSEIIEHDAYSLATAHEQRGQTDRYPEVILDGASDEVAQLVACFERAGVELRVRDITSDIGVPTYSAAALEVSGLRCFAHGGTGTHVDPAIAMVRAITEAAQSRAADFQGSREDLSYLRGRGQMTVEAFESVKPWEFMPASRRVPFPHTPPVDHADILDDIRWMVRRLAARGLPHVLVVDLTRPDVGVPVVRVIVPGLEHVAVDAFRVGRRVSAALDDQTTQDTFTGAASM